VDLSAHRTTAGDLSSGERAAAELRRAPSGGDDVRRRAPGDVGPLGLERLAEFAARLLGTASSQVSLLAEEQLVVAGFGLAPGTVGAETPLADSLCTVAAASGGPLVVPDAATDPRVHHLPPVTSGQVGAYLGAPLIERTGEVVGTLCVFAPEPREWSDNDVATLRRLAEAVVTELELSALVREYEGDRLRWGLAIDAAGIGAFDWDLTTGKLSWDEQLTAMFGYDVDGFDESIEAFNARLHPDDLPRVSEALRGCIETCGEYEAEYRVVLPDGETRWVHARGRAL